MSDWEDLRSIYKEFEKRERMEVNGEGKTAMRWRKLEYIFPDPWRRKLQSTYDNIQETNSPKNKG